MSSSKSPPTLFQATLFVAKVGAPSRTVFMRATSFVEAEALAARLAEALLATVVRHGEPLTLGGLLIEHAPDDLPPLQRRNRNGVDYMVEAPSMLMRPVMRHE